jgi:C4-dicarboxylate transporter DctM subunit
MNAMIIFVLLFGLMLTGMPISISLGLTVLTFLFTMTSVPIESVAMKLFTGIENFEIMAIPFFLLAGTFLTHGGVAKRMIKFATTMVGHWHGGIGLAGVIACALFASVCGSSVATVAAIGSVILPEMVKQGFPKKFGAGVITTSGALGILMLPSIIKVIYAVSTNTSIGALFIAGLIPGLILTTMLCVTTWNIARKNNYPRLPKATWRERWDAFRDSAWGLFLVVIVIGGIFSGIFTATEAAAMSAVYAFLISMTSENVPQALTAVIVSMGLGVVGFLAIVNVLLLLAGNVMEPSSIILIMAPILFPVAVKLGIDPIHFGIMMIVNMEVGMCHPPVGLNLYVASSITKMGITELTMAVLPWLLTMVVFLVLITYVPQITMFLPNLVYR